MLIACCMTEITDPRKSTNRIYSLEALVLLIFSAVISGYDSIEDMVNSSGFRLKPPPSGG